MLTQLFSAQSDLLYLIAEQFKYLFLLFSSKVKHDVKMIINLILDNWKKYLKKLELILYSSDIIIKSLTVE